MKFLGLFFYVVIIALPVFYIILLDRLISVLNIFFLNKIVFHSVIVNVVLVMLVVIEIMIAYGKCLQLKSRNSEALYEPSSKGINFCNITFYMILGFYHIILSIPSSFVYFCANSRKWQAYTYFHFITWL